ncbi:MAG: zinc-ribbon domain-containing protein [Oscillospiraceae bacterium]|nr:zinc-ribbon domain-containing protein [Oscillospiraceae bacterium]
MFCTNCRAQISDTAHFCPECGQKTETPQMPRWSENHDL